MRLNDWKTKPVFRRGAGGSPVVGHRAHRLAVEDDLAGARAVEAAEQLEERALARAGGPISATNSPAWTVSDTPGRASTVVLPEPDSALVRSRASRMAGVSPPKIRPLDAHRRSLLRAGAAPVAGRRHAGCRAAAPAVRDPAGGPGPGDRDRPDRGRPRRADPAQLVGRGRRSGRDGSSARRVGLGFGSCASPAASARASRRRLRLGLGRRRGVPPREPHESANRTVHIFLPSAPL